MVSFAPETGAQDVGKPVEQEAVGLGLFYNNVKGGYRVGWSTDALLLERTVMRMREPVGDVEPIFVELPFTMVDDCLCVDGGVCLVESGRRSRRFCWGRCGPRGSGWPFEG